MKHLGSKKHWKRENNSKTSVWVTANRQEFLIGGKGEKLCKRVVRSERGRKGGTVC